MLAADSSPAPFLTLPNYIHFFWAGAPLSITQKEKISQMQKNNPEHTLCLWCFEKGIFTGYEDMPKVKICNPWQINFPRSVQDALLWLVHQKIFTSVKDIVQLYILKELGGHFFDLDVVVSAPLPLQAKAGALFFITTQKTSTNLTISSEFSDPDGISGILPAALSIIPMHPALTFLCDTTIPHRAHEIISLKSTPGILSSHEIDISLTGDFLKSIDHYAMYFAYPPNMVSAVIKPRSRQLTPDLKLSSLPRCERPQLSDCLLTISSPTTDLERYTHKATPSEPPEIALPLTGAKSCTLFLLAALTVGVGAQILMSINS